MASQKRDYQIDQPAEVKKQVRALAEKAADAGILAGYVQAIYFIHEQLRTRPRDWGDPERRTHKSGGCVYHGLYRPLLFVQYVVFEPERVVCILKIKPLPNSPLA